MPASRQLFIFLALLLLAANYPEPETSTDQPKVRAGVTAANFARIKCGMARRQVEMLLGGPPATDVTNDERNPMFGSLNSLEIRRNGDLWRARKYQIWVLFDDSNRVTGMMSVTKP
jgi:hypothetical protein